MRIRAITPADDEAMAAIILRVSDELGLPDEGGPASDGELASLSAAYAPPGSGFFVVEREGEVLGGGGFAPLGEHACELRKMYLQVDARGSGMGRALLARCLQAARAAGYHTCHLQTTACMKRARRLYEAAGFAKSDGPPVETPPSCCETWMAKSLDA